MSRQRCRYLMDISPYPALCDNPIYYYGGGPTDAHCEGCEGYEKDPREANVTLLKTDVELGYAAATYRCNGCHETFGHAARNRPKYCPACGARVYSDECSAYDVCNTNPVGRMRELGIEVEDA